MSNNTLNSVSISSDGALDMTHFDFSVRSTRDEMRHIIGSSGLTKTRTGDADRRTMITWNSCASCVKCMWRGRYFVHELTSENYSRMQCVAKITAMSGRRTTVAVLCMFGLAACAEVDQSDSDTSNDMSYDDEVRSKCTGARIGTLVLTRATRSRNENKQADGYVKLPEQWRNS